MNRRNIQNSINIIFTINDSPAIPNSVGNVDIYRIHYPNELPISSGLTAQQVTPSEYKVLWTPPINALPGHYRAIFKSVSISGLENPQDFEKDFTLFHSLDEEQGKFFDLPNSQVFLPRHFKNQMQHTKHPRTWFNEEDRFLYISSGVNFANEIPSGCDFYIFPMTGIGSTEFKNYSNQTSFMNHFKAMGYVGARFNLHSLYTNISGQDGTEFVGAMYGIANANNLWGISTSGNYVHTDNYRRVYRHWEPSARGLINGTANSFINSFNFDFIMLETLQDLPLDLRVNPGDEPNPLMDYETFGWSGLPTWQDWEWELGLRESFQEHPSAKPKLARTSYSWFENDYKPKYLFHDTAASQVSGLIFQDDIWNTGEVWDYIQKLISISATVFTTFAYYRNCPSELSILGKAICMMTDSVFSPGVANYAAQYNYDTTQYSKYAIGDPIDSVYKIGNLIRRNFSNGYVEILDDGSQNPPVTIVTYIPPSLIIA